MYVYGIHVSYIISGAFIENGISSYEQIILRHPVNLLKTKVAVYDSGVDSTRKYQGGIHLLRKASEKLISSWKSIAILKESGDRDTTNALIRPLEGFFF